VTIRSLPDSDAGWLALLGIALAVAGAMMLVIAMVNRRRGRSPHGAMLAMTSLCAGAILAACTGWLIFPGTSDRAVEAVRSAALASGAVLAFYAMWLNDQRRRIDQNRLKTEDGRREIEAERKEVEQRRLIKEHEQLDQERTKALYERFVKAIELLGNSADQSRVGGLIMLRAIAYGGPDLAHSVLEQLCVYLRRPQDTDPQVATRELHVRFTAQQLLRELLTTADFNRPPSLDLSAARLDDLDLGGPKVRIGDLRLDRADLAGRTSLAGSSIERVTFRGSRIGGELDLAGATVGCC
jgi:hypothetical protein